MHFPSSCLSHKVCINYWNYLVAAVFINICYNWDVSIHEKTHVLNVAVLFHWVLLYNKGKTVTLEILQISTFIFFYFPRTDSIFSYKRHCYRETHQSVCVCIQKHIHAFPVYLLTSIFLIRLIIFKKKCAMQ